MIPNKGLESKEHLKGWKQTKRSLLLLRSLSGRGDLCQKEETFVRKTGKVRGPPLLVLTSKGSLCFQKQALEWSLLRGEVKEYNQCLMVQHSLTLRDFSFPKKLGNKNMGICLPNFIIQNRYHYTAKKGLER